MAALRGGGKGKPDLIAINRFKEKPDIEFAREQLSVEGLPPDSFLTVFGLYILGPALLEELERRSSETGQTGEVQLTDALEAMRARESFLGLVIEGEKIDIGVPQGYLEGIRLFAGAPECT